MGALAIVECFDVSEDLALGPGAGAERTAIDQLELESAPEAFDGSLVVTVAFTAHRGNQDGLSESAAVFCAGVLHAAIRVEQQIVLGLAMQQSHSQSF